MDFKQFNFHDKLLNTIEKAGFLTPTAIQEKAIPIVREGRDLRATAQTGTGKTAAFILPALQRLAEKGRPGKGPRILILTPTRELAMQIANEASRFGAGFPHFKTVCIFGGVPYPMQNQQLSRPYEILVASPGRLIDHLERGRIDLKRVEMLILDEADRMLDMGFIAPVEYIVSQCPSSRQTLLFSATLSKEVLKLSDKLLKNPAQIAIVPEKTQHEQISQHFREVNNIDHKYKLLDELLDNPEMKQAIIFTATKRSSEEVADKLSQDGREVGALHGDMNQRQRTRTIKSFRDGRIRILVATDIAARGLDVLTISHVVNFDLPSTGEDYVHRIGRTGRAGATGIAFSFAAKRDRGALKEIEKFTGQTIPLFKSEQGRRERTFEKKRPFKNLGAKKRRRY